MDGETEAAVEAARAKDGATLWDAYKRQIALVYAGEADKIAVLEWVGEVGRKARVSVSALIAEADDNAMQLLFILADHVASAGEFLASDKAAALVTSDRLSDATKVELFNKWAARTEELSKGCIAAALPVLARIARSGSGTALGYFGEFDIRNVACSSLFHLGDADERDDLVTLAADLGLVEAAVAIAKAVVGTPSVQLLCNSGVSSAILNALRRPDGYEEQIAASLGVEHLDEALMPDEYPMPTPVCAL